jgi:hypothetical protein
MHAANAAVRRISELWQVLLVAVGVALAYTFAGAYVDHIHQVSAEELAPPAVAAVPAGDQQVLHVKDWGVRVTLPLAVELPLISYARLSTDSIGLSSADLTNVSPLCRANHGALGSVTRYPAGTFAEDVVNKPAGLYVRSIGGYDYAYQRAVGECLSVPAAQAVVNREEFGLLQSLESLTAEE